MYWLLSNCAASDEFYGLHTMVAEDIEFVIINPAFINVLNTYLGILSL